MEGVPMIQQDAADEETGQHEEQIDTAQHEGNNELYGLAGGCAAASLRQAKKIVMNQHEDAGHAPYAIELRDMARQAPACRLPIMHRCSHAGSFSICRATARR
jgi:hypothetical protein